MKTPFTGLTMLTKQGAEPLALKERVKGSSFQLLQGQPGPLT